MLIVHCEERSEKNLKPEEQKMNENVKKVLNEQLWYLGTCGDEPNVVPVGFKAVLEDGTLAVGDAFMKMTRENVLANGKIAIAVCDAVTMEAYQIKGSVKYVTEDVEVDLFQAMAEAAFKGAVNVKGALLITPEKIIVAAPGPNNNQTI